MPRRRRRVTQHGPRIFTSAAFASLPLNDVGTSERATGKIPGPTRFAFLMAEIWTDGINGTRKTAWPTPIRSRERIGHPFCVPALVSPHDESITS